MKPFANVVIVNFVLALLPEESQVFDFTPQPEASAPARPSRNFRHFPDWRIDGHVHVAREDREAVIAMIGPE